MNRPVFKHPHHATYVVYNIREVADFLYEHFGMLPWRVEDHRAEEGNPRSGFRAMIYSVGPSLLDFSEPYLHRDGEAVIKGGPGDLFATELKGLGPGVFHVAWAVEDIDTVVAELASKGNGLDARHGHHGAALHGSYLPFYRVCNILPESIGPAYTEATRGQFFQVAEGTAASDDLAQPGNFYLNVQPSRANRTTTAEPWRSIHHVTYVVDSVREMGEYLERNLGLVPDGATEFVPTSDDDSPSDCRVLLYLVGGTLIEFCEPLVEPGAGSEAAEWARMLEEAGPGIFGIGWSVDDVASVADKLVHSGLDLDREVEPHPVHQLYRRLDLSSSFVGAQFRGTARRPIFQLAEGLPTSETLRERTNLDWRALPEAEPRRSGGSLRLPIPASLN